MSLSENSTADVVGYFRRGLRPALGLSVSVLRAPSSRRLLRPGKSSQVLG